MMLTTTPGAAGEVQLWETYSGRIYRYLCRLTGNAGTAEDLTQETFLQAIRDLRRLPAPPENVSAWPGRGRRSASSTCA